MTNILKKDSHNIPDSVYKILPGLLSDFRHVEDTHRRDLLLLSSLVAMGSCMPNYFTRHSHLKLYPHQYLGICAKSGSYKGIYTQLAETIIQPVNKILYEARKQEKKEAIDQDRSPRFEYLYFGQSTTHPALVKGLQCSDKGIITFLEKH